MIRRNQALAIALALGGSAAVHASGLVALAPAQSDILMAGGAGSMPARLGDGFEDLVAGTLSPVDGQDAMADVGPATAPSATEMLKPLPADEIAAEGVEYEAAEAATPELAAPVPLDAPEAMPPVATTESAEDAPPEQAADPVAVTEGTPSDQPAAIAPVSLAEAAPALPGDTLVPVLPSQTVLTAIEPAADEPPKPAARPAHRPETDAEDHEETKPAKPVKKTGAGSKSAAAPRGNSDHNETRGSPDGTEAEGATVAKGDGGPAQAIGNGSAENYGGKVLRRVLNTRKAKSPARGIAVVGFTIAPDGSLARVRILRSSGNPDLDAVALDHIRRAQPFPRPPVGLKREWSFEFEGRS